MMVKDTKGVRIDPLQGGCLPGSGLCHFLILLNLSRENDTESPLKWNVGQGGGPCRECKLADGSLGSRPESSLPASPAEVQRCPKKEVGHDIAPSSS